MIKAIAFDLDNTLIDFIKIKKTSCEAAADAMIRAGLEVDRKKLLSEIYKVYETKGYEYQKVFQDVLKKMTGRVDKSILAHGVVAYKRVKEEMLFPYKDVKPTLAKLHKRYRLAILSDAPVLQPWIRLAAMDITQYFNVIIGYEDTKKKKPDKRPFLYLLKKLKLKPNQVMFVGDSPRRDIYGAKRVGMATVLAKYGGNRFETERRRIRPDYTIGRFRDLLKIA